MAELSELWWLGMILAAFAGGAFGAAIGALPAFVFTGFLVMLGEGIRILSGDVTPLVGLDPDAIESATITSQLGFGAVFGPHISFAAGAAASAYAAKKGKMDTGFPYHEAKNIAYALGPKPDVMLVGGLFGILGYWIASVSTIFNMPWDPIAMAVVLSAFAHRLVFKFPIIGKAPKGLFNMEPFEKEQQRDKASGRLLVEPWLGHQYKWWDVTMLGAVVGILGAFITWQTGSMFLGFGISAASLLFLNLGVEKFPVTHHITLISGTAVYAAAGGDFAGFDMGSMLLLGALFGVIAALFGELIQRVFYAHSDTHFDPPAAAIVLGSVVIVIFYALDIFETAGYVPVPF